MMTIDMVCAILQTAIICAEGNALLGYILLGVAVLLLGGLVGMFIYTWPLSKKVYEDHLVRTSPDAWGRACSAPENEEQLRMWNDGLAWAEKYQSAIREVDIENEGFRLFGEYFDFGFDKCAIILPGRCECLMYSYYFGEPYRRAGYNVLVIDSRCHGKSEGKYSTAGVKESSDVLAWAELVHSFGNREVCLHGICIGTSAGLFAMNKPQCPEYITTLVTEGCYVSLRETFKRHMMAINRPIYPVLDMVMLRLNKATSINIYRDTPIRAMKKLSTDKRVLFLYGKEDIFSIPSKSQKLFDACAAADKKLVWFDHGGHSHLRINNVAAYDDAIAAYLEGK